MKKELHSSKSFGPVTDKVVFFFTAAATRYWLYYPAIRQYVKAGFHVVVFDVTPRIVLDGDINKFLQGSEALVKDVGKQISTFRKNGVKYFYSHGTSMGTLFAMRSAIDYPEIKKIIINFSYGRIADTVWSWYVLRRVKRKLIAEGITADKLESLLETISPIAMAKKLKGKKVLLYLAKYDRVMLFKHSIQFKEALDKAKVDYKYIQNNFFGHQIAGSINNLRSKIYLDFLAEKK